MRKIFDHRILYGQMDDGGGESLAVIGTLFGSS